ncbi:exodeoxyribonuclease VII small subunit [Marinilactibacillus sp. GCM10026970]|uniref:exodeoxyribonuclease VII small subunit n=1 Tax=unclassified Marinilactibacillus TaxID=2632303 RepID=UPI001CE41C3E|nr:exodeoxyribonuclease VII small subunit [Marinilactibacillus sp. Marseille-P9653]
MEKEMNFDDALKELEEIVSKLEQGDVPLEEALDQFQEGIKLSRLCKKTLQEAEETMTKIVDENGKEAAFENDLNRQEN